MRVLRTSPEQRAFSGIRVIRRCFSGAEDAQRTTRRICARPPGQTTLRVTCACASRPWRSLLLARHAPSLDFPQIRRLRRIDASPGGARESPPRRPRASPRSINPPRSRGDFKRLVCSRRARRRPHRFASQTSLRCDRLCRQTQRRTAAPPHRNIVPAALPSHSSLPSLPLFFSSPLLALSLFVQRHRHRRGPGPVPYLLRSPTVVIRCRPP